MIWPGSSAVNVMDSSYNISAGSNRGARRDAYQEPIATSYSAPGVLAEAAHKTGRAKADFELREISREEYERLKSIGI